MLTVYVLKNGVGRYYIFFNFYLFYFLESSKEFNAYPHNIHTFIRPTQWPHSVKRLRMCDIVCWNKSTWHKPIHWRILHENDTKRRIQLKFIILVSNLKEISPSVFSWKKEYIKNYDAILLSKYDSAEKKDTKLCLP
jgi:hypothetical protein